MKRLVLICFALAFMSCRDSIVNGGRICSTEARVGIQVAVRDVITGLPAATDVLALAQDHSFIDTLRTLPFGSPDSALTLYGVYERAGVYSVMVKKTGYRDWIRTNVVVDKDECHVITVQLDARLERVP
jgi:hypothetical protein